jgi:hypothetical protein
MMFSLTISQKWIFAGSVALIGLAGAASTQIGPERASQTLNQVIKLASSLTGSRTDIIPTPRSGSEQRFIDRDNSLWSVPLTSLAATREHPIFTPSRRPRPTAVKANPLQTSPTQPPLILVGAIAGEAEGIAIFQDKTTKNIVRLKPGESHSGWILQNVKAREVTLQNEQRGAILTLPTPLAK